MTPEEIKKIARVFAEETSNGDALDPHIDFAEGFASEVLQWLSKDYAIAPKEQVVMRHGVANALMEQDPAHKEFYRGQSSVLEGIFDKSLFEEEGK